MTSRLWLSPDPPEVGGMPGAGGVGGRRRRGGPGGGGARRPHQGPLPAALDDPSSPGAEGSSRCPVAGRLALCGDTGERVLRGGRAVAGVQWWRRAVLLLVAAGLIADSRAEDCPLNDISGMQCSLGTQFMTWDRFYSSAGLCLDGKCQCVAPFSGPACARLTSAAAPAFFTAENGLDEKLTLQGVQMKSWVFLAKTCWGPSSKGRLRVQMRYSNLRCPALGSCQIEHPAAYNKSNVPNIIFYAHYDDAFESAVLTSYFPTYNTNSNSTPDNPYCGGQGSVYAERLTCKPAESEGDPCIVDKTYQVSNNGAEQTMIYLALGGCELQGLASWNVTVESTSSADAAEVCGARGTQQAFRCYSEAGGSCGLQNTLKYTTQYQVPQKLSRAEIAIISSCFVLFVTISTVFIKFRQSRLKRAKQRAVLDKMTKDFNNRGGGANGAGGAVNGNGLPPTYTLGSRSAASPEALTGHFSISGGMR